MVSGGSSDQDHIRTSINDRESSLYFSRYCSPTFAENYTACKFKNISVPQGYNTQCRARLMEGLGGMQTSKFSP
jgi:hypothetical protein